MVGAKYVCKTTLARLDKRTKAGRLLRAMKEQLTTHIGGNPTPPERLLIDRACVLALKVAQLDQRILNDETITPADSQVYLSWQNNLRRTLIALNIRPSSVKAPTLADHLSAIANRHAAD
jgi:hypothetical protein